MFLKVKKEIFFKVEISAEKTEFISGKLDNLAELKFNQ